MKWMKDHEAPSWAYHLGTSLIISGFFIQLLIKSLLLGTIMVFWGAWLHRWWYQVPVGHSRFEKISEQRFRFGRKTAIVASWLMLFAMVAVVFLTVFRVLL